MKNLNAVLAAITFVVIVAASGVAVVNVNKPKPETKEARDLRLWEELDASGLSKLCPPEKIKCMTFFKTKKY